MKIQESERLSSLPPYIFSEINRWKAEALNKGISLVSLGIGDPDKPTPPTLVKKLQEAAGKEKNHAYSPYNGTAEFRNAVSQWFEKRFGVSLDPEKEVLALIGSKEGIAHFPVAFCNPGDVCLYPSPGYPVFSSSILLGGGIPVALPMTAAHGFLPDPKELESLLRQHRPKYLILNFPSNPTTTVAPKSLLSEIVRLARQYDSLILSDNAYSEMYYDDDKKPPSLLEIPGAKEISIELHSFSKTFNMTGWRIGFAVGNETLVQGLLRAKTQIDSGPLLSVQEAAIYALTHSEELTQPIRAVYSDRRALIEKGLKRLGIEHSPINATFFVWAKVPTPEKSLDFARGLIEKVGLVVTPGIGFGDHGEGFFRLALTVENKEIDEALKRLEAYLAASYRQG